MIFPINSYIVTFEDGKIICNTTIEFKDNKLIINDGFEHLSPEGDHITEKNKYLILNKNEYEKFYNAISVEYKADSILLDKKNAFEYYKDLNNTFDKLLFICILNFEEKNKNLLDKLIEFLDTNKIHFYFEV